MAGQSNDAALCKNRIEMIYKAVLIPHDKVLDFLCWCLGVSLMFAFVAMMIGSIQMNKAIDEALKAPPNTNSHYLRIGETVIICGRTGTVSSIRGSCRIQYSQQ